MTKKNHLSNLRADTELLYRKDRKGKGQNHTAIRELQNAINGIKDQMKLLVDKMNNLNTAKETITGEGGSFDEE